MSWEKACKARGTILANPRKMKRRWNTHVMIVFNKYTDNTGFHIRIYYCSIQYMVKNARWQMDREGSR